MGSEHYAGGYLLQLLIDSSFYDIITRIFQGGFFVDKFNSINKFRCKLCNNEFLDDEMIEEHYPARSTGNEDIVALDLIKMFDTLQSENIHT